MIKIVTDTTCDLPLAWVRERDITVVPINIHFGTDSYKDGVDMDQELFYQNKEMNQLF